MTSRRSAGGLRRWAALLVLPLAACAGADPRPSRVTGDRVVLVVVDTLRADHVGVYGHARPTTPNLDAWARRAKIYERCLATSPWTAPSFGSLFTGELPARHGVMGQERPDGTQRFGALDAQLPTVAEILSARGWATAAIVNNPFLSPEFGLDRGFGRYDYAPGTNAEIRRADVMVDLALDWIDQQDEDSFFLVVHLFDPHVNYDAPPPFRGRFTAATPSKLDLPVEELNEIRSGALELDAADHSFIAAAYDEEIAFVDQELGRLLEGLDERGVLERGLVLLSSDHGEELFDHGGFEHGHALWQELLHVPMIVWGRPVARPGRESAPMTIADVAPTILDFAGHVPAETSAGRSLLGNLQADRPLEARRLYAEQNLYGTELKAVLEFPYKLIVNVESGDRWLFDLADNPHEQLRPWDDHAATAERLEDELYRRVARDLAARGEAAPAELDASTLDKLRSLGYVD